MNARIDSAINGAAARLTNAKPSDNLRSTVMSRVATEQPSRFPWRFVFAGGALASVALVALVSWPANSKISNPTISNPTVINPTVINSRVNPTGAVGAPSPVTSVVKAARTERAVSYAMSTSELEWSANAPPALERPEPLKRVKLLEMKPIDNITPLGVAPLVVPALGDDGSNR